MELWDIYDEERRATGRTAIRGVTPFEEGEFHLVVHICAFSKEKKMLIQRRALDRNYGGLWDLTAGGSAVQGETSRRAAERELREEVGIRTALGRPSFTINFSRGFDDYFFLAYDGDIANLHLQAEEVCDVKWATCEEILAMIRAGEFVQYRESFIPLLFEMFEASGMIRGEI